jgi:hypothetical protein
LDTGIIIGYEDIAPIVMPIGCPIMHLSELYSFDGHIVATTFSTARILLNMVGPKSRSYYVYDLPWIRPQILPYDVFQSVFTDLRLNLLARCTDHAKAIENAWNRQVKMIWHECHLPELMKILDIEK